MACLLIRTKPLPKPILSHCQLGHLGKKTSANLHQNWNILIQENAIESVVFDFDVVDRCLRRMGDKTIPDEAPPSLESFYPPWVAGIDLPQSRCCGFFVSFTIEHK